MPVTTSKQRRPGRGHYEAVYEAVGCVDSLCLVVRDATNACVCAWIMPAAWRCICVCLPVETQSMVWQMQQPVGVGTIFAL